MNFLGDIRGRLTAQEARAMTPGPPGNGYPKDGHRTATYNVNDTIATECWWPRGAARDDAHLIYRLANTYDGDGVLTQRRQEFYDPPGTLQDVLQDTGFTFDERGNETDCDRELNPVAA